MSVAYASPIKSLRQLFNEAAKSSEKKTGERGRERRTKSSHFTASSSLALTIEKEGHLTLQAAQPTQRSLCIGGANTGYTKREGERDIERVRAREKAEGKRSASGEFITFSCSIEARDAYWQLSPTVLMRKSSMCTWEAGYRSFENTMHRRRGFSCFSLAESCNEKHAYP